LHEDEVEHKFVNTNEGNDYKRIDRSMRIGYKIMLTIDKMIKQANKFVGNMINGKIKKYVR
jgi:hypothetical protein